MKKEPTLQEQMEIVERLRNIALERYGIEATHPIARDLDRLERDWKVETLHRIQRALDNLKLSQIKQDLSVQRIPSPETFDDGELIVGQAVNLGTAPAKIRLHNNRFPLHWLIGGVPGAGKTSLVRLILQLVVATWPWVRIILFDPSRSYESLCSDTRLWLNISWADLKLSPFCAPTGYSYARWLPQRVDALCRAELKHSKYLVQRRLESLFAAVAIPPVDDGVCVPPSLGDLRDNLSNQRERPGSAEERYRGSSLNVVHGRCLTGDVFHCNRGMEDALANARVRIDIQGLSPLETIEYLETEIVQYVFTKRMMALRVTPPELHTLIVLEEAQNIVGQHPSADARLYHELLMQSRALGLGFVFVAHDLEKVDNTIFSAVSNFALFAQSSASNKKLAGNLLNLSRDEQELIGSLKVGHCFMRMVGHPTWPHPFLMRVTL